MSRNKLIGLAVLAVVLVLGIKSCSSDPQPKQVLVQQPTTVQSVPQQAVTPVQEQPQIVYQDEQAPQYDQQQPNVVVVQQPPQTVYQGNSGYHSGGIGVDHLAAGALGYMAGKSSANNQRYAPRTRTIIRERTIVRPAPRSYYGSRSVSRPSRSFSRPSRSFGSRSFSRRR